MIGKKSVPTYQLSRIAGESIFSKIVRWIRYNLVVPDGRVGWYPFATRIGTKVIEKLDIKLIFSSGPPQTTHLTALFLSKKHRLPWVADFRDPWTDRFYYSENKRLRVTELLDKYLEKKVIDKADAMITVSRTISEYYDRDVTVIPNGFDDEDFTSTKRPHSKDILITYVGTMSKSQNPTIFFDSVYELNKVSKNIYRIYLIGNIHPDVIRYIDSNNFRSFIEIKPYVPHKVSIQNMIESDFLLLVIPNTGKNKGVITGKIFEYIRSGSTIIMIGPLESDAAKIIKETSSGFCLDYHDMREVENILSRVKSFSSSNYAQYSRQNLTKQLVNVFNKTIIEAKTYEK